MTSSEIRTTFLEFFKSKQHQIVPSAPMVVKNDPTLMFTNAGMNQFKDIFLGNQPAKYKRVADTQKCLRVSGKHNDLEEVGIDTYHHTMFEMLGNWSFGDYFKKEAIAWAWELLTDVYKLPKDRLYVTVFEGDAKEKLSFDQDAYDFWKSHIAEDRILKGNKKDNFWEMGEQGPCGPCSEIHIDLRNEKERKEVDGKSLVNASHPQVIEIWNNVFMEFNRKADGSLEPLPAKHVDTGMGFERLCMALQGKTSNYDTDVFQPMIQFISARAGIKYGTHEKTDIAMRVMSDHIRAITCAIADGQLPSNNKAGYVIRRILRRAVRYGFTFLNFKEPFLNNLVPILAEQFKDVFPEIKAQQDFIIRVIAEEENSFLKTLGQGIYKFPRFIIEGFKQELFVHIKENYDPKVNIGIQYNPYKVDIWVPKFEIGLIFSYDDIESHAYEETQGVNDNFIVFRFTYNQIIDFGVQIYAAQTYTVAPFLKDFKFSRKIKGEFAFELYDTFGFPIDLTQLMAREKGLDVDMNGFNKCLTQQKERSRAAAVVDTEDWIVLKEAEGTEFVGYDELECDVEIIKYRKVKAKGKEQYQLVFNKTPFYAESGGQVGDTGSLVAVGSGSKQPETIYVTDTQKENNLIIHFVNKLPTDVSAPFHATVDKERRKIITSNHSATHLMHSALKRILGSHVNQKGSLVNDEVTRFDFSHFAKVTDEELEKIEQLVNEKVRENIALDERRNIPIKEAQEMGATALFGEKYGDYVRVITFDPAFSRELCGGTHVKSTGQIQKFKIISESSVAAGVRRIEAITGELVDKYNEEQNQKLAAAANALKEKTESLKATVLNVYSKMTGKTASDFEKELLANDPQQPLDETLQRLLEKLTKEIAQKVKNELLKKVAGKNGVNFLAEKIDVPSTDAIKNISFELKNQVENLFFLAGAEIDGKAHLSLIISDNLVAEKKLDATRIIRDLAKEIQGGGGGQAFYATAGGKNPQGLQAAIEKANQYLN